MKVENLKLSIGELLAVRQWLCLWENAMRVDAKFIRQTLDARQYIDKLLWGEIISPDTPWGKIPEIVFSDNDFENTLKTLLGEDNGESKKS